MHGPNGLSEACLAAGDAAESVAVQQQAQQAASDGSAYELQPYPSVFAKHEEHALAAEDLAPYQQQYHRMTMQAMHEPTASSYAAPLQSTVLRAPLKRSCSFDRPAPDSPFKSDRLQHAISHPVIRVSRCPAMICLGTPSHCLKMPNEVPSKFDPLLSNIACFTQSQSTVSAEM